MDKSGSQKFLKVISIIDIILGAGMVLLGIFAFVGGAAIGSMDAATLASEGIDADAQAISMAALSIAAVISIGYGAISIIEGILGVRAANDPSKIMPVWILAIIGLAGSVITVIMGLLNISGMTFQFSQLITVAINGFMFWIANNIKNQN